MSSEDRSILNRRGFLAASGGVSLAAFMAACGGSSSSSSSGAPAASSGGGASPASSAAVQQPKFDPATEPDGPLQVFEWEGYDDPKMWASYHSGPYDKKSPLKFTLLNNDQQALAKVASGVNYDIIHPCIAYWPDWQAADLIQPWDTSLLPNLHGIPDSILTVGQDQNGLQWHVPFDIGFSSLVYRTDKIKTDPPSWNVFLNSAYKGRMSMYSDEVTIIKIGHMINNSGKLVDPNKMNQQEIDASAATMTKAAANFRNFWDSETAAEDDFINGNIDCTYVWPDGYYKIKNHPKMKGVDVQYMWPLEGRLAWVCGFVLGKNTKAPGRSTLAVAAANEPAVAAWLTDTFQYSAAQKQGVEALITNKDLIHAFSLDDPAAWAPPATPGAHGAWFEHPIPNRAAYVKAGQQVKASIGT
jgi:spermidine/putrescine transport system substrate-binding protein